MIYIEDEAVETALRRVEELKEEYENATGNRNAARHRYLEALRAYTTIVKARYHI